jgi:hypothetical protein
VGEEKNRAKIARRPLECDVERDGFGSVKGVRDFRLADEMMLFAEGMVGSAGLFIHIVKAGQIRRERESRWNERGD